jgi:hypothetical protein
VDIEQVKTHWTTRPVYYGKDQLEKLLPFINGRGFIAGSFAAWACSPYDDPWKPNDIDIFAKSAADADSLIQDMSRDWRYWLEAANDLVFTYKTKESGLLDIQIVYPSPEWKVMPDDLINSFDLDVSRAVIISADEALADVNASDFHGKVLLINNPLRTLKRIVKYAARGVKFNDHEIAKVFRAWDSISTERKESIIERAAADALPRPTPFTDDYDVDEDDYFDAE